MRAVLVVEEAMFECSLVHENLNRIILVYGVITIQRRCPNLS